MASIATPKCPLRFGDPCSLCVPGASGPQDCQTVKLVLEDPDLRALLNEKRKEWKAGAASKDS